MQHTAWAPLTAFTAALVAVWWITHRRLALDHPNSRSLHETPTPRMGGVGLHIGVLLACATLQPDLPWTIWPALGLLYCVSFADDLRGLAPGIRLTVHFAATGLLVYGTTLPSIGVIATVVTVIATVWLINLYNFMDGSDGLAGGMTCIGFGVYGVAAVLASSIEFAVLNFSITAAAAAFLVFNFPPARIFMGDVGSVPLGFLAAAIGITGWLQGIWDWWFPGLVFSPFIADATVTLTRRALRGALVWEAHHDHYYQRLIRMGWGHKKTALTEYALMAMCGLVALLTLTQSGVVQAALIAAVGCAYAAFAYGVDSAWRRHLAGSQS